MKFVANNNTPDREVVAYVHKDGSCIYFKKDGNWYCLNLIDDLLVAADIYNPISSKLSNFTTIYEGESITLQF